MVIKASLAKLGISLTIQLRSVRMLNLAGMADFQVLEFLITTIILEYSHAVTKSSINQHVSENTMFDRAMTI